MIWSKVTLNLSTETEGRLLKMNNFALPPHLCLAMLGSVLEFMYKTGVKESEIRDAFKRSLPNIFGRPSGRRLWQLGGLGIGHENIIAEVLRLWHRDDRYIDGEAKPKPLFLTKGRNNLRATIKRLSAFANATEILRDMKAVKLIRRTSKGRYLPTSETAIVSSLHPLATDHIAKLVIRLVSTVSRNVDPTGASLPLIERHVYTPDLNPAERKAFAEFTRIQGMAYLEAVDNWLEQRRVRRMAPASRRTVAGIAASVHLFAYLGDRETGAMRQSTR
jgi:hypothetical protein